MWVNRKINVWVCFNVLPFAFLITNDSKYMKSVSKFFFFLLYCLCRWCIWVTSKEPDYWWIYQKMHNKAWIYPIKKTCSLVEFMFSAHHSFSVNSTALTLLCKGGHILHMTADHWSWLPRSMKGLKTINFYKVE